MPTYQAFGLNIDSCLALPELKPGANPPDAVIRRGSVELPPEATASARHYWAEPGRAYLFHPGFGAFAVEGGSRITMQAHPGVSEALLRDWLLGPAVAILLHQRGHLVLHASAAVWGGKAIAILGDSGAGKSTTAMAICRLGGRLLSDDHAVIALDGRDPMVLPAGPTLRLFPEVLVRLGEIPECHSSPPAAGKLGWPVPSGCAENPYPLKRLYLLADGPALDISPLAAAEAFLTLVRHSCLAPVLALSGSREQHFHQCARLTATIPLRKLQRPRSLDRLEDLVRFMASDLERA